MSRRNILTWSMTTGTVAWGTCIWLAVTGYGSDRLHMTCLIGAFLITAAAIIVACLSKAVTELRDAVAQTGDELHDELGRFREEHRAEMVEFRTSVLCYERGFHVSARALMAGLVNGTRQQAEPPTPPGPWPGFTRL
jgi:hypothetical protein